MSKLHDDVVQKVDFTRTATKDAVTGDVKYSAWNPEKGTFEKYTVPTITGYTATPTEIKEMEVDPDTTKDSTVNVVYTPVGSKIVVNFIDTQNNNSVVDSKVFSGKFGETATLDVQDKEDVLTQKGYIIGANNFPAGNKATYGAEQTTFNVELTHQSISIDQNNAEANGVTGLTKEVTRTITFNTAN